MRTLATVQTITNLMPIEGADRIELAQVLGWQVIVKREEFKVGDLCVYCEVDSVLPDRPEFEFLRSKKFRIKTMKMKNVVSQGICFPLSYLPKHQWDDLEGDDVTTLLGVTKYDPEGDREALLLAQMEQIKKNKIKKFLMRNSIIRKVYLRFFNKKKDSWPSFIQKTDEERVQKLTHLFETERDAGTIFEVGEKLDGQSGTYFVIKNPSFFGKFMKPYIFGVCSRNFQLTVPDNSTYWRAAKKYDIEYKLTMFAKENKFNTVVLQGEILDPKVQGNKYKVGETQLYVFNLIIDGIKQNSVSMSNWCKRWIVPHVPIITTEFKLPATINDLVEYAKGFSILNKDTIREGIVLRNYEKNISFKCINPDFLLKFQDEDEKRQEDYRKEREKTG